LYYLLSFSNLIFNQNPRSTETWNITTVRAGVALKFGQGKKHQQATDMLKDASTVFYQFPSNVPAESRYNEIFPLRNYVYFNGGLLKYQIDMFN
jgi:hypothetical protein